MGWTGIVILGAVVGCAGWWLHPLRAGARGGFLLTVVVGVLAAVLAKVAGSISGVFLDGEILEWPVCMAVALAAVTITARLRFRH